MKKLLIICIAVLTACSTVAQTGDAVKDLKQEKKVLMLNAKLKELQIDFEKEKAGYDELTKEAAEANATANSVTTDFSTSDASSTVKDAKAAINKLKEAKKINKKLAKSQKKLKKLQKKIDKTQESINKLDLVVKIHEN